MGKVVIDASVILALFDQRMLSMSLPVVLCATIGKPMHNSCRQRRYWPKSSSALHAADVTNSKPAETRPSLPSARRRRSTRMWRSPQPNCALLTDRFDFLTPWFWLLPLPSKPTPYSPATNSGYESIHGSN